jgi:hypothetical protein
MPTCSKCNKRTFDGTRWNSAIVGKEFSGKYLCHSCYQETEKELTEYNRVLNVQKQDHQIDNQRIMLNAEIEATKDKLKQLESMQANNDLSGYSTTQLKEKSVERGSINVYFGSLSVILGALSFLVMGIPFSVASIVLGCLALKHKDRKGTIGVIIGVIGFVLNVLILLSELSAL